MSRPEDSPPPASTHKICADEETAEGETQNLAPEGCPTLYSKPVRGVKEKNTNIKKDM